MDTSTLAPLAAAHRLAEDVLLPGATDVDRGRVPVRRRLDALADAGLYGLRLPRGAGGPGVDRATTTRVVESLAGGCLTTAFVWIQHLGASAALARAGGALAGTLVPRMATGEVRAGIALGGVRPGRDPVVASPTPEGGHTLHGTVPWITGWGLVDVLLVAARDGADGDVLWFLVDAPPVEDPGGALRSSVASMTLRRVAPVACDQANSAVATLDGHPVPPGRLLGRQRHDDWLGADAAGLRTNGSLALGVAGRCAVLAEDTALRARVDDCRAALDAADGDPAALPPARAAAADLAWTAAQVLLARAGGAGVGLASHPQRLAREAALLQVFGSRPAIRDALLARASSRVDAPR